MNSWCLRRCDCGHALQIRPARAEDRVNERGSRPWRHERGRGGVIVWAVLPGKRASVRDDGRVHVLVGRGGEFVAPFFPVCGDPSCICHHGLAGLASLCPVEFVTVAEHPDLALEDLTAACAAFLSGTGWDDESGETALYMACYAAEIANGFPIGTRLRVDHFDDAEGTWDLVLAGPSK
jgi:hypothetical protein